MELEAELLVIRLFFNVLLIPTLYTYQETRTGRWMDSSSCPLITRAAKLLLETFHRELHNSSAMGEAKLNTNSGPPVPD